MILLTPHPHNDSQFIAQVMVDFETENEVLKVKFQVKSKDLNINEEFSTEGWKNDGLWDFDVVELFLRRENKNNRYIELEISPKGQKVAILVRTPRNDFESFEPQSIEAKALPTPSGFDAEFKIPLSEIPGKGEVVFGNAHACLGKVNRNYFSLFEGRSSKPDFHRPEFFQPVNDI